MGYGILQRYELSLRSKLVDAKSHELLQVMGYQRDGLWQSRLYNVLTHWVSQPACLHLSTCWTMYINNYPAYTTIQCICNSVWNPFLLQPSQFLQNLNVHCCHWYVIYLTHSFTCIVHTIFISTQKESCCHWLTVPNFLWLEQLLPHTPWNSAQKPNQPTSHGLHS